MEKMVMGKTSLHDRQSDYPSRGDLRPSVLSRLDRVMKDYVDRTKPLWRGDHTFSKDAANYSLEHFIEPEVVREHPDWTKAQVHEAAVSRFEKRLAQDLQYERHETEHQETVVDWHVVETAPGIKELATEYGGKQITLKELWEHTKEYASYVGNPAAYNPAEEQSQIAMQDMFVRGEADAFVSVLSHPDSIRYVQVWQRSGEGVVSKQVDLFATTGRDFSQEEAKALIGHLQTFEQTQKQDVVVTPDTAYVHFFIKNGQIHESDIKAIAQMQRGNAPIDHTPFFNRDQRVDSIGRIVFDTKDTLVSLGVYVKDRIDQTMQALAQQSLQEIPAIVPSLAMYTDKKVSYPFPVSQQEHKQKQKQTDGQDAMRTLFTEWIVSKKIAEYAAFTPQGSGAALFWLRFLTLPPVSEITANKKVHLPKKDSKPTFFQSVLQRHEHRFIGKRRKDRLMKHTEGLRPQGSKKEQPVSMRKKESQKARTSQEQLTIRFWRALRFIAPVFFGERKTYRTKGRIRKENRPRHERMRPRKEHPGRAEKRLIFALMILWFISASPKRELSANKRFPKTSEHEKRVSETPWILFSIIWYLAMLREQGALHQKQKGKKKRTRSVKTFVIVGKQSVPSRGIIYPPFMIE